jgi:esterase/lipase
VAIGSFDEYVDDLAFFVERVREREGYAGKPIFLFGHSMGGAIVTLTTITRRPEIAGVILSAPALRLDMWPITIGLTRLAGTVAPNAGAIKPPNRRFSTDPAVVKGMDEDPLIHQDPGRAHTAAELGGAIERIWADVDRLTVPLLLLHGTGDTLTSPRGSRDLRDRAASTDKTLVLYDGLAHDLVHEPGGKPIADTVAWVSAHAGGPPFAAPAAPDLGEPRHPSTSVRIAAHYRNASDDREGGSSVNAFTIDTRNRLFIDLFHPSVPYCLGLDGSIGAGAEGIVAAVDLHAVGVGVPFGDGSLVSLCGGAGFSKIGDAVPFAWRFPIDAALDLQLGPVRLLATAQIAWSVGDEERNEIGSETLEPVDELAFGLGVRWGANHRYWSTTNAGAGPYLGVTVHEIGGGRFIGVVLGLDIWGGN